MTTHQVSRSKFPIVSMIVLLIFSLLLSTTLWASTGKESFKKGIHLSKQGKYREALIAFKSASQKGYKSAALSYNLAVSYYQLLKYSQAYTHFLKLVDHPNLSNVAFYNLGLTQHSLNDGDGAIYWFERCEQHSKDKNLRVLCQQAILDTATEFSMEADLATDDREKLSRKKWHGSLSMSVFYDDNVGFDNLDKQTDYYLDVIATTHRYLVGNRKNGLRISGKLSGLVYDKNVNNENNRFTEYQIAINHDVRIWGWYNRYGVSVDKIKIGDDETSQIGVDYKAYRNLSKGVRLKFRIRNLEITPNSDNLSHLEGSRLQIRSDLYLKSRINRLKLSYTYEFNDRKNFASDTGTLINYSPIRHTFKLSDDLSWSAHWWVFSSAQYRYSRYQTDNRERYLDNEDYRRIDKRLRYTLELQYRPHTDLHISVGMIWTKNQSTRSLSEYQRNLIALGIRWFY